MRLYWLICLIVFAVVMELIGRGLSWAIGAYGPPIVIPFLAIVFTYAALEDWREGRLPRGRPRD
jgi:hypothetical protein